jgi:hypothetical protein
MSYTVDGYEHRAHECARLASLTDDDIVRSDLLELRQNYSKIAERLKQQGFQATHRDN